MIFLPNPILWCWLEASEATEVTEREREPSSLRLRRCFSELCLPWRISAVSVVRSCSWSLTAIPRCSHQPWLEWAKTLTEQQLDKQESNTKAVNLRHYFKCSCTAANSPPRRGRWRKKTHLVEQLLRVLIRTEVRREFKILSLFWNISSWLPRGWHRLWSLVLGQGTSGLKALGSRHNISEQTQRLQIQV